MRMRSRRLRLPIGVLAVALLGAPAAGAEMRDPGRFAAGDAAYEARRDHDRALEALAEFERLFEADPGDWEAAWRVAMASYYAGIRVADDSDEKRRYFERGREAGKAAVRLRDACAPCHLWTGVNTALYGDEVGVFKMVRSLGDVKDHLERSIEIDPAYANTAALRILGNLEERVPGILGGSNDRAERYYRRALKVDPGEPLNYLFYARFLRSERGDRKRALDVALRGLEVPRPGEERVESVDALRSLDRLVEELGSVSADNTPHMRGVIKGRRR